MPKVKHSEIRPIKEIKQQYRDEWIEIEITKMADDGFTALEGRLIAHGKDREKVMDKALAYVKNHGVKGTYSAYTGELTAESILL